MSFDGAQIDAPLVTRLITTQFPRWADLPVVEVVPNGWDNRTFRLGGHLSARLPSAERYVLQVAKEHHWLPKLAPHVPLPIPRPVAVGKPGAGYPWQWLIYEWLDGETATPDLITGMPEFAEGIGEFLADLQATDAAGGPRAGVHNFHRGGNLAVYDDETRQAISVLADETNRLAITEVWNKALSTTWQKPPVWVHGDVSSGNLLVADGRLCAVIDFGGLGIGDPACDLSLAWTMFEGESREAFRSALSLDDATWARGRGWVLWKSLIVLAGLSITNAAEAEDSRRILDEVLADHFNQ